MIRRGACSAGRLKEGNHDEAGGRGEKKTTPISKMELIPSGHPFLNLSSSLYYSYYYHFPNRAGRFKPKRLRVVRLEQEGSSYNFGDSKNQGVYPSPLVSFHFRRSGTNTTNTSPNSFESRPGFSPLTNYVMTIEQTWLTNMVYAPLM